ncbi:MAG TPA: hypothetical protein VFP61_03130 [Acidimicrobiales bacterium]|nr:hypothetical protein [Acidimicrobiales bacterium]
MAAAGFWAEHGGHLALAVVPAAAMALSLQRVGRQAVAVDRRVQDLRASLAAAPGEWRGIPVAHPATGAAASAAGAWGVRMAAAATVAAAMVHLVVMPEHFGESWLYGVFFLLAASVQVGWAALLVCRPDRGLLGAGLAGSVTIVALWAATRVTALAPLGAEAVGTLDVVATACEALAAAGAAAALLVTRRGRTLTAVPLRRWPVGHRAAAAALIAVTAAVAPVAPVS